VSHAPQACEHVYSAWSTEERLLTLGEKDTIFVMTRRCVLCNHADEGQGEKA
jgi:hypothetical protein